MLFLTPRGGSNDRVTTTWVVMKKQGRTLGRTRIGLTRDPGGYIPNGRSEEVAQVQAAIQEVNIHRVVLHFPALCRTTHFSSFFLFFFAARTFLH